MLGDDARGRVSFDPQRSWAPFCDVICIWSISTNLMLSMSGPFSEPPITLSRKNMWCNCKHSLPSARLVTRTKKHDSISSILRNLHWLPIQSRIHFKVLLFAYQCSHQFGPSYIVEWLTQYKPERTLRSSKKSLFHVPQTMTRSYGERSFSYAAPVLWNNLPEHVRNIDTYEKFRTSLKSHLFNTLYMS